MPRKAIIDPHVVFEGFMSQHLTREQLKNLSLDAWTHFYHKPYECDWAEAREKARDRKFGFS